MGYLKSFSDALVKRTKDLEQQVETLVYDQKSVDVKLHNTFNRFLMLSNTQFIENVCPQKMYAWYCSVYGKQMILQ